MVSLDGEPQRVQGLADHVGECLDQGVVRFPLHVLLGDEVEESDDGIRMGRQRVPHLRQAVADWPSAVPLATGLPSWIRAVRGSIGDSGSADRRALGRIVNELGEGSDAFPGGLSAGGAWVSSWR